MLNDIGPNPPECRQVWIKNVSKGVYFYVLEIKLANSSRTQSSSMKKIECGRETKAPELHYEFTDSQFRQKLIEMAFQLIKLRDKYEREEFCFFPNSIVCFSIKSNRWQEKIENQIQQALSTFANLTGSLFLNRHDKFIDVFLSTDRLHLNLKIESKSSENNLKSYRLMMDGKETSMSIPAFTKEFPLEVSARERGVKACLIILSVFSCCSYVVETSLMKSPF